MNASYGVARLVRRAQKSCRERVEPVLVALDELLERPAVALLRALYEWSVRIIHT